MNRIRAWWRRYFGRRTGRHIARPGSPAELALIYLADVEFWKTT